MSKHFNYRRAHAEWADPRFQALPASIHLLWNRVVKMSPTMTTAGASGPDKVPFPDTDEGRDLREAFEQHESIVLAEAQYVIYRWGHWAHMRSVTVHYPKLQPKTFEGEHAMQEAKQWVRDIDTYGKPEGEIRYEKHWAGPRNEQQAGAYWKFEALAKQVVIARDDQALLREPVLKQRLEWPEHGFMDHKPGTKWELDELHQLAAPIIAGDGTLEVIECRAVNFRPHPFTIGVRHMEAARNGILDESAMRAAPCAYTERRFGHGRPEHCTLSYDEHTHDRVMLVRPLRNLTNEEARDTLLKLQSFCDEFNLDGFGFLPSEFTIEGVEHASDPGSVQAE